MSKEDFVEKCRQAANRLHHLSMRYSGALMELVRGEPVGFIPLGHPGLSEARDLIDLILFTRAEINGLSKCLIAAGVLKAEDVQKQFAEEYKWFAEQKAKMLKVKISDTGLVYELGDPRYRNPN